MIRINTRLIPWALCTLSLSLAGCAALEEDKVDYKTVEKGSYLEVPPDLTQLQRDSRYSVDARSANAVNNARPGPSGVAPRQLGPARIEHSGKEYWLVTSLPPEQVWSMLKDFWTNNGLALETESRELGIMETVWAENRAKLPQDIVRRTLGKFADGLFSTGMRDRYRTRLDQTAQGLEVRITHRGMVEDFADLQKSRLIWVPRPSDPELEIEFLRRLMVHLGGKPQEAQQATAAQVQEANLQVSQANGQPVIDLNDDRDRAWRRVGVALDRSGFTVQDRDRSKGLYFVRYVAQAADTSPAKDEKPGFFARLFSSSSSKEPQVAQYRILVAGQGMGSRVSVQNAEGQALSDSNAGKILQLLAAQMR